VTISSNFLSGLLETDAIVLHCAFLRHIPFRVVPAFVHSGATDKFFAPLRLCVEKRSCCSPFSANTGLEWHF
jgi:hypothetical protein